MDLERISKAFYLGYLWSLGRRFAMDRAMAMDAKRDLRDVRWVTINGTHVPISKKTGKIVGPLKDKIDLSKSVPKVRDEVLKTSKKQSLRNHNAKSLKTFLGPEITGVKGIEAIKKLLSLRKGYVRNAFKRVDVGEIDVAYGDGAAGLAHIVRSRSVKTGGNPIDVFSAIPNIIKRGRYVPEGETTPYGRGSDERNVVIEYGSGRVILSKTFKNEELRLVLSAYIASEKK